MRVELDFEGDATGADHAAGSIDASLKALERTTRDLVAILKQIRLDDTQVTKMVGNSEAMAEAVSEISDAAERASRDVKDVKYGTGQAAAFVAESALMAAALDRVADKADRVNGAIALGRGGGAFGRGMGLDFTESGYASTVVGPTGAEHVGRRYGPIFVDPNQYSSPIGPALRRIVADTGIPAGGRIGSYDMGHVFGTGPVDPRRAMRSIGDDGIFSRAEPGSLGLSGGDARGSGGGSDIGNFIRRIRGGDDGNGRSGGGNLFGGAGGGLFRGVLPGGRRAGAGPILLGSALGASVAQPVGLGALGLLAALPTFIVGMGGAVAVLAGSLGGLGKAIGGNRDAFDKLDKQSQTFVQNVRSYEPFFERLQALTRASLLPGLSTALNSALSPTTGGLLQYGATTFGRSVGNVAQQAGSFIGSQQFTQLMKPLIDSGSADFEKIAHSVGLFTEALLKLGVAGIPIANWLSDAAVKAGEWINKMLDAGKASGRLSEIMGNAKTALSDVGHLIESLAKVVYNLAAALGPVGDQILRLVTDGFNRLSDWLAKNREQITNFIQTALNVLVATLKILWDILTAVVGALVTIFKSIGDLTGGVISLNVVLSALVSLAIGAWAITAASGMSKLKDAMLLMARNPQIIALLAALAALGALKSLQGNADTWNGNFPPGTTDTADIKGDRLKNANEVIALRKKGWSDQKIQMYILGEGGKPIKGFPQFAKGSSGDLASSSAFTDANALTVGQGKAGGVMPATTEAGNSPSTLLQGPHHTDGFPGSGKTAVDIAARVGAPVLAPEDGQITRDSGSAPATSGTRNINGYSLYYQGVSGTLYYMTHMSWVAGKGSYKKGDKIGVIADHTQGGAHLHVDYAAPVDMANANTKGVPPPFDIGNKGDVLPQSYQLAIAKAGTTPGTVDDVKAYRAAISYIKSHIPSDAAEATLAYQEEKSLMDALAAIARKAKAGRASPGSKLRGINSGNSILSLIAQAGGSASSLISGSASSPNDLVGADPLGLAQNHFAPMLAQWKKQIKDFEKELREKTISTEAVSTITARMAAIKTKVSDGLTQIKQAAQQQAANFKAVWTSLAAQVHSAFQEVTDNVLADPQKYRSILPISAMLADLQDQKTQDQLNDALQKAKDSLAKALSTAGDQATLDAARKTLGQDLLAHAIDVAQSYILGGSPMDMTEKVLQDMKDALAAGAPDPKAVEDAQQAVADAELNIKIAGLQKQAKAEVDAYKDSRTELQKHLDAALALWEKYYENAGTKASEALAVLNAVLKSMGLPQLGDQGGAGNLPVPTAGNLNGSVDPFIGDAIRRAGGSAANIQYLADGGIVSTPHFLVDAASGNVTGMIGERGKEAVVPMGAGMSTNTSDQPIIVEIHTKDEALADFIDVRVINATGRISRAQGVVADSRRRAGRY